MKISTGTGPSKRGPSSTNVSPERKVEATAPDQATNNKARPSAAVTVENLKQFDAYTNTLQGQSGLRPGPSRRKTTEDDKEPVSEPETGETAPVTPEPEETTAEVAESDVMKQIRQSRDEAAAFSREQPETPRDEDKATAKPGARRQSFIDRYRQVAGGSKLSDSLFDFIV